MTYPPPFLSGLRKHCMCLCGWLFPECLPQLYVHMYPRPSFISTDQLALRSSMFRSSDCDRNGTVVINSIGRVTQYLFITRRWDGSVPRAEDVEFAVWGEEAATGQMTTRGSGSRNGLNGFLVGAEGGGGEAGSAPACSALYSSISSSIAPLRDGESSSPGTMGLRESEDTMRNSTLGCVSPIYREQWISRMQLRASSRIHVCQQTA